MTATCRLPNAVITTMGSGPARLVNSFIADSPSSPGSRTSSTIKSGLLRFTRSKASSAEAATVMRSRTPYVDA